MDDLISRQAVRLIESDSNAYPEVWNESYEKGFCDAINRVLDLPSAQPEVIRCKDCIWFDRYTDGIEKYQWDGFCADWARKTYENWYCSRAERRNDG